MQNTPDYPCPIRVRAMLCNSHLHTFYLLAWRARIHTTPALFPQTESNEFMFNQFFWNAMNALPSIPSARDSFFTRLIRRYHKQRADNTLQHAVQQRQYYRDHDLLDTLSSSAGSKHNDAMFALRIAKRAYSRSEINAPQLKAVRYELRSAISELHNVGDDHRMRFSEWMQDFVIPQFANNVLSFVYAGAGVLVMIVGLRGLGDLRPIGFIPDALLDADGMLRGGVVFAALCLELFLLLLLAILFFFTPDVSNGNGARQKSPDYVQPDEAPPKNFEGLTREALQALIEKKVEEIRMIERIQKML